MAQKQQERQKRKQPQEISTTADSAATPTSHQPQLHKFDAVLQHLPTDDTELSQTLLNAFQVVAQNDFRAALIARLTDQLVDEYKDFTAVQARLSAQDLHQLDVFCVAMENTGTDTSTPEKMVASLEHLLQTANYVHELQLIRMAIADTSQQLQQRAPVIPTATRTSLLKRKKV